ncbi:MAG: penicillin-binding transpeptidase domain-containing protein [Terracidiphilus sp.]
MMDTREVRIARFMVTAAAIVCGACFCRPQSARSWVMAAAHAAKAAPDARIVVLDVASGNLLASTHLDEAGRTLAAPGSTLKPLLLYSLIAGGRWDPSRRIACTRKLRIAGRSLNCSHPPADPMDARQALAWSCNTYFAAVGESLAAGELRRLLAPTGLLGQTGLARDEAVAELREPRTPDESSLAVLGVDGILVTPLELAVAYRWLAVQLAANSASNAAQIVEAGLTDSASFGIAASASLGGVPVAGKTGTANMGAGTPSHGWFAGLAPAGRPSAVVVVYLPAGHGANAAEVAADLLEHSPLGQTRP